MSSPTTTTDPEPSSKYPPPRCMDIMPEPTADRELEPAAMKEPETKTEPTIARAPRVSALVRRHPACGMNLRAVHCTSSLHPFGSIWLGPQS
ncbi:hypothetical protein PO909_011194 [Leuciscus waleckii]